MKKKKQLFTKQRTNLSLTFLQKEHNLTINFVENLFPISLKNKQKKTDKNINNISASIQSTCHICETLNVAHTFYLFIILGAILLHFLTWGK